MKIKKEKILVGVKEVEARILRSLEHPSSDGYMPDSNPAWVAGFKRANLVGIASQQIKTGSLDKSSYDKFVRDVVAVFSGLEVSRATVHYMSDYSSSCVSYLESCLNGKWAQLVAQDPSNQVLTLMTTVEQSLQQGRMQDYKKQFADIKTLLTSNTNEFEVAERLSFQNRLTTLSVQYQTFMEAELRSVQATVTDCQGLLTAPKKEAAQPAFFTPTKVEAPKSNNTVNIHAVAPEVKDTHHQP